VRVVVIVPHYAAGRLSRFEADFGATFADLVRAADWVRSILTAHRRLHGELEYTLESTACYHCPVIWAWGGRPTIINPTLAGDTRRKTDKLDARRLAYHALTGIWPASFFPSYQLMELRCLAKARRNAQRAAHRALLSIGSLLLKFGFTFTSQGSLSDGVLRPTIEDMVRGLETHDHFLIRHFPGHRLPPSAAAIVTRSYRLYDEQRCWAEELQKQLINGICCHTWKTGKGTVDGRTLLRLLQTVPGVGPVTAAHWLTEIGDVTRFPKARTVAAYCGFDPSLKVSAGKVSAYVRRKGNAILHKTFIEAAGGVLARGKEPIGVWGQRIRKKRAKGGYQRAVAAVARRLVEGCYYVHLHAEAFSYAGYRLEAPDDQEEKTGGVSP